MNEDISMQSPPADSLAAVYQQQREYIERQKAAMRSGSPPPPNLHQQREQSRYPTNMNDELPAGIVEEASKVGVGMSIGASGMRGPRISIKSSPAAMESKKKKVKVSSPGGDVGPELAPEFAQLESPETRGHHEFVKAIENKYVGDILSFQEMREIERESLHYTRRKNILEKPCTESTTIDTTSSSAEELEGNVRFIVDSSTGSWSTHNVIDGQKIVQLCHKNLTLHNTGMKIDQSALEIISKGVQMHLKNVLEVSILNCRRRNNIVAISAIRNIENALDKFDIDNEEGITILNSNIGLSWGPDALSILEKEERDANRLARNQILDDNKIITEELRSSENGPTTGSKRKIEQVNNANEFHGQHTIISNEGMVRLQARKDVQNCVEVFPPPPTPSSSSNHSSSLHILRNSGNVECANNVDPDNNLPAISQFVHSMTERDIGVALIKCGGTSKAGGYHSAGVGFSWRRRFIGAE